MPTRDLLVPVLIVLCLVDAMSPILMVAYLGVVADGPCYRGQYRGYAEREHILPPNCLCIEPMVKHPNTDGWEHKNTKSYLHGLLLRF
jgi:hypothetical protein